MDMPRISESTPMRTRRTGETDYSVGLLYAIATAALLALQEPFSALAARTLSSLDFMALTQLALLLSLPFLISRRASRRDFAAILLDIRQWPKLAVIFLVGLAGLSLYDIGLSSAHPIITAAVLNLSPFWAALVAFAVSRRSISISPWAFWLAFVVAFCGAMAIAWSQIEVDNHALAQDVIASLFRCKWVYALPMPAFFALSGTLVYEWFSDYDEAGAIGANFAVSALVLLPAAAISFDSRPSAVAAERAVGHGRRAASRRHAGGVRRRAAPLPIGVDENEERQRRRDDVLPPDPGDLGADLLAAVEVDPDAEFHSGAGLCRRHGVGQRAARRPRLFLEEQLERRPLEAVAGGDPRGIVARWLA